MNKEKIRNILESKNEIEGHVKKISISDIQLGQMKLLEYEYECRVSRINKVHLESLREICPSFEDIKQHLWNVFVRPDKKGLNQEQLKERKKLIRESEKFLKVQLRFSDLSYINKYFKYLQSLYNLIAYKDGYVEVINCGDFLYEISDSKIKALEENGLASRFESEIKNFFGHGQDFSKGGCHRLILGNHDDGSGKYDEFYKRFFDSIHWYLFSFEENKLVIWTHEPITEMTLELLPHHRPFYHILKSGLVEGKEIVNIHGHVHSQGMHRSFDGKEIEGIKYRNACLDYYVFKNII